MMYRDFQKMFLAAGMPEDRLEGVLDHFHAAGEASDIPSLTEYETAKTIYAVMDASVPAQDFHSPVARYVISLGGRIAAWEVFKRPDAPSVPGLLIW